MADGQPIPLSLYIYAPNKGAPIFFALAFAVSAIGHIWQCWNYECFRLIGLHPLCAAMFTAGYALREYGAFNYLYSPHDSNLIVYIMSQIFIYVCPPLLELANYHVLGRILYYVPFHAPLPPNKVLSTFGILMVVVETLNAVGISLSSNAASANQGLGSRLIMAAIALQLIIIVIFVFLASAFHYRCAASNIKNKNVSTQLRTLYISMALIFIRCIYRLVEHMGSTAIHLDDFESLQSLSPTLRYEWYFYVFEATLMLLNSILWNVWNPGRYLPKSNLTYLSPDGRVEVEASEELDERSLLIKAASTLTFGLFFRRKESDRRQRYQLRSWPSRGSNSHIGA